MQGGRGAARNPGVSIPTQRLAGHHGEGGHCPQPSFGAVTQRSSWRDSQPFRTKSSQLCFTGVALFGPWHASGQVSLVARMVKNLPAVQATQVQSLGQGSPLEKGMATHSSILAWRIPWTEALNMDMTE